MKKIFLFLYFLLVGCMNKNSINISELSKEISKIETNNIDIEESIVNIENNIFKKELKDIRSDLSKYINLDELEEYAFYNEEDTYVFIIKTNIDIKNNINKYFNDLLDENSSANLKEKISNRTEYKYGDYYIYIVSDNNKPILDKIIETKHKLFDNTTNLSNDAIIEKYGLEIDNSIFVMSTKLNTDFGYIVISNIDNETENKLDNYYKDNKNLLKIKRDNITVYSISEDNNKVKKTVDKYNINS